MVLDSPPHLERAWPPLYLNLRSSWANGGGFRHQTLRGLHALRTTAGAGEKPLAGTIIIASYVATGLGDLGSTAFGPNEPLVLLHATALSDLRQRLSLRRASRWGDACSIAGVIMLGTISTRLRTKRALAVWWAAALVCHLAVGVTLIYKAQFVVGTVFAAAVWTLASVVELGRRHSGELFERLRMRSTMGMYFSVLSLRGGW